LGEIAPKMRVVSCETLEVRIMTEDRDDLSLTK
jgi:hypothetical protein